MHFLCNVRLGNGRIQVQKYRGKMFSPCSVDTWMRGQCYVQYLIPRPSIKSHLNENNKSKSLICWESSCCFGLQWANDQLTLKRRGYKMVRSEPRPTIANNHLTIKQGKKVCKATALRSCHCFPCTLLPRLSRPKWLIHKNKKLHCSVVNSGGAL